jgi:hypothetical protein
MNEPMHDLLAEAIDRRTHAFAEGRAFADRHGGRVLRSIRARRAAATAGTAVVAAALVGGAGYGVVALVGPRPVVPPAGTATHAVQAAIETELIEIPTTGAGLFEFYVDSAAIGMEPSSGTGMFLPGAPSASILVTVVGESATYDLTAPGAIEQGLSFYDMGTGEQQVLSEAFDVVGDVTSTSSWGLHFYLADGHLVTEQEGRSRADAVEVTAMIATEGSTAVPATPVATALVPLATNYSEWYYFYVTFGATDRIPYPPAGMTPPDNPEVPSDAILVWIHGGPNGYDLTAPGAMEGYFEVLDADLSQGDAAVPTFDVIGDVTSTTSWGIHFYLVDDHLVTLEVGRSRADAVEVTAMFDPASATVAP